MGAAEEAAVGELASGTVLARVQAPAPVLAQDRCHRLHRSARVEVRRQPPSDYTITLRGVTLEEAIAQLTKARGLDYTIVGEKTVRIYKKA